MLKIIDFMRISLILMRKRELGCVCMHRDAASLIVELVPDMGEEDAGWEYAECRTKTLAISHVDRFLSRL